MNFFPLNSWLKWTKKQTDNSISLSTSRKQFPEGTFVHSILISWFIKTDNLIKSEFYFRIEASNHSNFTDIIIGLSLKSYNFRSARSLYRNCLYKSKRKNLHTILFRNLSSYQTHQNITMSYLLFADEITNTNKSPGTPFYFLVEISRSI